jgi:excinuclease UvrABC nuclease subunit
MTDDERGEIIALFQKLISSALYRFPTTGHLTEDVTINHGVYVIYGADGQILHVGKSSRGKRGLFQRLTNHLNGQSSFVNLYFNRDKTQVRICGFRYLAVEDPRRRALLEAYAIGCLCPAHIGLNEKVLISN